MSPSPTPTIAELEQQLNNELIKFKSTTRKCKEGTSQTARSESQSLGQDASIEI